MKRGEIFVILFLFSLSCLHFRKGVDYPIQSVTIRVRHQLYPKYKEIHKVKLFEFFDISDTDYKARVVKFLPDFAINEKGKIFSRSKEVKNPAVLIEVWKRRKKVDEVWAFREGSIPHFKKGSFLIVEIVDISLPLKETDNIRVGE